MVAIAPGVEISPKLGLSVVRVVFVFTITAFVVSVVAVLYVVTPCAWLTMRFSFTRIVYRGEHV